MTLWVHTSRRTYRCVCVLFFLRASCAGGFACVMRRVTFMRNIVAQLSALNGACVNTVMRVCVCVCVVRVLTSNV